MNFPMKMSRHNTFIIVLFLFYPFVLTGQNLDYLYSLYQDKKMGELKAELDNIAPDSNTNPDLTFLRTLFIEDGDAAVKIYESLSENTSGILKYFLSQKLAEYYYARGYYIKSEEWRSEMQKPESLLKKPTLWDKNNYKIQVGAFSFKDNASKLHNILGSNNIQSEIIQRKINDKTLFCVWIEGKTTREETEVFAEQIKSRFRLKYQIIQP